MSLTIENVTFPNLLYNTTSSNQITNRIYYAMIQFIPDPYVYVKEEKEQRVSPWVDLQSGEPDTGEKSNTREYEIFSIEKQIDNLKKSVQFYEYTIDISLLNSIKADIIDNSSSP
ncbi:6090_t:CDS:2 [Dentiscutata heterogama]|uniref:6090_t:CDS:1 n=1 Tax=Dentiscutata heterogama TaxID=1316150 RepID=A0ACA9LWB8_9GLOM|nr:6090_t:CDS:2 [Dentiscutata heterogama]